MLTSQLKYDLKRSLLGCIAPQAELEPKLSLLSAFAGFVLGLL
jgi:hypothetical protein